MIRVRSVVSVVLFAFFCGYCGAQQISEASLPEAPDAQQAETMQAASAQTAAGAALPVHQDKQPKRILGIFPNFRAVDADVVLPPQSVKEKFVTATEDSFDYSAFVLPVVIAGEQELENDTPEFHGGAPGYARYFWHTYVDQTSENYFVEFIVPTIMSEDTRYYTLGAKGGGTWKRIGYALSRTVITRSDFGGNRVFNAGEIVGAGTAAGISNFYYPSRERSFSNTASKWGLNVGIDGATFVVREFWPDINHALFHGHAGDPQPGP